VYENNNLFLFIIETEYDMYVIPDPDIIKRIMGLGCDIYTNEETQLL
jgi:hypothetical protein